MARWLGLRARFPNAPRQLFGPHVRFLGRLTLAVHGRFEVGGNVLVNRDCSISTMASITIGDNVWIGAKCTVVGGVTIGDDAVVAANPVVTRDIPPHSLAASAPARVSGAGPRGPGRRRRRSSHETVARYVSCR